MHNPNTGYTVSHYIPNIHYVPMNKYKFPRIIIN